MKDWGLQDLHAFNLLFRCRYRLHLDVSIDCALLAVHVNFLFRRLKKAGLLAGEARETCA
jgi:hypothetical protein